MKLNFVIFVFFVLLSSSIYKIEKCQINPSDNIDFKIDSVRIYTGVNIKSNLYTPVYRYQDSLFCNYDTLIQKAIWTRQTCTIKRNDSIFSILEGELIEIKEFRILLKDSSKLLSVPKSKFCDIDGEISDCFELFYQGKSLKIGLKADNLLYCYFENRYIKMNKRSKLLKQLMALKSNYNLIND
jgi:hypothetical protein